MQLINLREFDDIQSDAVRQCVEYACKHDLQTAPAGRYNIDGDEIYVVISEYRTVSSEAKAWEAHKEYIDLQMVIEGEEIIEVAPLSEMTCGEYVPENDFLPCEGKAQNCVDMKQNEGLLLFPEDAHKPGVLFEKETDVKKAVFKIHCSRWEEK